MSTRRGFLKEMPFAGGIFYVCGYSGSVLAWQQQPSAARPKRREVTVAGRRVSTIDLHCHLGVADIWKVIPKDQPVPDYLEEQARTYRNQPVPTFNPRGADI